MDNLESVTNFFCWTSTLGFGVLMFSWLFLQAFESVAINLHSKLFHLNEDQLRVAYFYYLAIFKIFWLIFALIPYVSLRILGS